jgi:AraC-like DNA-binding protein
MPRLRSRPLFAADGLLVRRVACDGVDEHGAADERSDDERVIFVLHGRFAFEDSRTRAIASPAAGLFLADGQTYRIRHLDGGDVCVALQGDVCTALLASGSTARRVPTSGYVAVQRLAARLAAGEPLSRLAVEETLSGALAPADSSQASARTRDRELAAAIAYRLDRDLDARLSLVELTAEAGVSVFHACRAFRRATGLSIHRYQQEIRLRHALALLLDTDRPVAQIAMDLGFANQGHLTNLFRRRYRTTPARARRDGLAEQTRQDRRAEPNRENLPGRTNPGGPAREAHPGDSVR